MWSSAPVHFVMRLRKNEAKKDLSRNWLQRDQVLSGIFPKLNHAQLSITNQNRWAFQKVAYGLLEQAITLFYFGQKLTF